MAIAIKAGKQHNPKSGNSTCRVLLTVLKWSRRVIAGAIFLLWGAFFIEHVREWYLQPAPAQPPLWVGLCMVCHLAVLIGLLMILRWDRLGSFVTLLATVGFLAAIAIGKGSVSNLPAIVLVNLIPIGIAIVSWLLGKRSTPVHPA